MTLVNKIKYYKTETDTLKEAVELGINYCIEHDVLAEFLRKNRSDVMTTCLTEFKQELYEKDLLEEGRKEGQKSNSIENARNLFLNGVSYEIVRASITHLTDEELQAIYNEVTGTYYNK